MKNTIIKSTLAHNYTIKSNPAMTGEQVGIETFAQWKNAVATCHRDFYKYECDKHRAAGMGEEGAVDATKAFNSLQTILDLVGEVNGHKIVKNQAMLDVLSAHVITVKEPLAGMAWTLNEEKKSLKKELDNVHTGMSEDYISGLEDRLAEVEEELRLEKKKTNSCAPIVTKVSETTFRKKFEKELYRSVIEKQAMKSWEELEAEEQARKEERKAKAKARKQAKRQAEAQAKAQAEA